MAGCAVENAEFTGIAFTVFGIVPFSPAVLCTVDFSAVLSPQLALGEITTANRAAREKL